MRLFASGALLALTFCVGAAAAKTAEPPPQPLAAAWQSFVRSADVDAVSASYGVLGGLSGPGGASFGQCQERLSRLERARTVNPFSPALQSMIEGCVQALGDFARLRQERARGVKLREYLLADGRGSSPLRPVEVAAEADAAALIESLGGEPLYARYSVGSSRGSLPFVAVYFDPVQGREQQLVFDFLRLWQRLRNHDAADQYPAMLGGLIDQYLEDAVATGNLTAELAKISVDLVDRELASADAVAHLEELALEGSAAAAIELLPLCLTPVRSDRCAENAVDLLRPLAQRGLGEARLMMALAADEAVAGAGGRREAQAWLRQAAARLGEAEAWTAYAQLAIRVDAQGKLKSAPAAALRRAARAGHAPAQMMLARLLRDKRLAPLRGERAEVWVERAAAGGSAAAKAQLAMESLRRGDATSAAPLLQQAAAENNPSALGLLALSRETGLAGSSAEQRSALDLYRAAAAYGNAGAMRRLGNAFARGQLGLPIDMLRAEAWYLSASTFGNRKAAAELAELYLDGTEGMTGKPADGYAVIERLAADGLTSARLRMAKALLLGQGVEANSALALKLLTELAESGVATADFRLGQIYEFAQGRVPRDLELARAHYLAAAQAGHLAAMDYYARALYAGRGGPRDRIAAVNWWEKAVGKGHRPSIANLAWARCSSLQPGVHDPLSGTRLVSDALQQQRSANLSDTLAVCLAASGLYQEAVDTQKQTLEMASRESGLNAAQTRAFAQRLIAFQRGEAWVEPE